MIKKIFLITVLAFFVSCAQQTIEKEILVSNKKELHTALENVQAGDHIVLKNGIWKDLQIEFKGEATKEKPIVLKAETSGNVFLEGQSNIKLAGKYLQVEGLTFQNGFTPTSTVISFKIDKKNIANHCKVTNCVIKNYTQPKRTITDHWVEFWGRHNELSNCYLAGKFNQGPTIEVNLKGNQHIKNYHQIVNNHFGPKPRKGGPKAETIRIGNSFTSMAPSFVNVSNNLFEKCNGEVEIISSKSNFNEFRNNLFYECEGSLVVRHGNYCIIDGNFFIGNNKPFVGGIRVINTGHWVTNNYFYQVIGEEFRSPLAIMNGIPKSPLNRYNQVTDAVIAHNTWIDCTSPWQFSVGANQNKKDILPKQEIRSARPIRTVIANNMIFNHKADKSPFVNYDKVDGILFKNNLIDNQNGDFKNYKGIEEVSLEMKEVSESLFVPSETSQKEIETVYNGFEFESIKTDAFGNLRSDKNAIGAISNTIDSNKNILDKNLYGPKWFTEKNTKSTVKTVSASTSEELITAIEKATNSTIIDLKAPKFEISKPLVINQKITLRSKEKFNSKLIYKGEENTPLFEMHPYGTLHLKNVSLKGNKKGYAFAANKEKLSSAFNLNIQNTAVEDFKYIIKSYKGSFSDEIVFDNTAFKNCENGIELAAETDDKGDYNAEFLTIINCNFNAIDKNILNFYRGGYDESTIGGYLTVSNTIFENCGAKEASKILLKTRGIINVSITENTFKNNPVKLIALLWGEKNNTHSKNKISNSGKMRTDKYLKQKLVY